jgi:hypothetical protein
VRFEARKHEGTNDTKRNDEGHEKGQQSAVSGRKVEASDDKADF